MLEVPLVAALARFGFREEGPLGRLVQRAHAAGAFAPGVTSDLVLHLVEVGLAQLPLLVDLDEPDDVDGPTALAAESPARQHSTSNVLL